MPLVAIAIHLDNHMRRRGSEECVLREQLALALPFFAGTAATPENFPAVDFPCIPGTDFGMFCCNFCKLPAGTDALVLLAPLTSFAASTVLKGLSLGILGACVVPGADTVKKEAPKSCRFKQLPRRVMTTMVIFPES